MILLLLFTREHDENAEKKLSTIQIVFSVLFEFKVHLCDFSLLRGECSFILRRGEVRKMDMESAMCDSDMGILNLSKTSNPYPSSSLLGFSRKDEPGAES